MCNKVFFYFLGSVERCNQDVENMLRSWMSDNNSTEWSLGCYFVQFQKNSSHHRTIGRSPYKALFGHDPVIGLSSTYLPRDPLSKLENEEDLQQVLINENPPRTEDIQDERNAGCRNESKVENAILFYEQLSNETTNQYVSTDQKMTIRTQTSTQSTPLSSMTQYKKNSANNITILEDVIIVPASTTKTICLDNNIAINDTNSHTNVQQQHSNNIVATEVKCCICQITTSDSLKCSKCQKVIHGACGVSEVREGSSSSNVKCNLCWQEDSIKKERTSSHENLKRAAATMCTTSNKKFKEIDVGATILVDVPKYDRAPLDNKNITGRVIDKKNGLFQVGTSVGIIKDWLPRNALQISPGAQFTGPVPEVVLSIRGISSQLSPFGGQGFKQCHCKKSSKQCSSNKCACKKHGLLCNSKCHKSLNCCNK